MQDQVKLNGWALESRIYAEDPYRNFLPSTGRLTKFKPPQVSDNEDKIIRNDAQIIDMRNNFDYNLGTFKGAINLCLINFTDLKDKTAELGKLDRKKKTAIFCTGGIRCEKAGKYLSDIGFEDIYQLQGGIINYLNSTKNKYWKGECFVFDDRILLKGNS